MTSLSRQYCAYFGEATEVWKRYVIGEIIVAFDEYRDSVCKTLQDADNSGPDASTGGGQDVNNQEEMFGVVLENAQQQAEQRIVNALNQTLNQPLPPPVSLSPVVSILANQTAHVNPPAESAISQSGVISGQNDDNSLDVSIKSEVDSSSESECESDTDDDEMQVKEEPNEDEEDITGRSGEQTENTNNNNSNYNHENNDSQMGNSSNISSEFNSRSNPENQINVNEGIASDNEVDGADDGDGNLEEDETVDNMEIEESPPYDRQESDNEGSMIDEENGGEEADHLDDQVNMSGVEENDQDNDEENEEEDEDYLMNDEESTDDTTDDDDVEQEQAAEPSTSTGRRSTRQVLKRQTVPAGKSSKGPIKVKKTEKLRVITLKLKCSVPGCKKVVKSKNAMNSHLLASHKLKEFRCLVRRCHGKVSASFTTKAQLTDHLDQVHGRTSRLACHCSKKFNGYTELYDHYWQYHRLGLFACSKDDCTFKPTRTRIKVLNHLANHRDAKYECPVDGCGKSFKHKGNRDQHTLTHSGERPFPCPECAKSFSHKSTLTAHLRIHQNDKCYRCTWPQCTHSSTQRSNAISHIRVSHFKLPKTKRQQAEENINDDRDPRDYLAMD